MNASLLRCLVAEADPVALRRLVERLWAHPRLKVIGTATGLDEAAEQVELLRPDVALVSESIGCGPELAPLTRQGAGLVFLLAARPDQHELRQALAWGVRGLLPRDPDAGQVLAAVDEALGEERRIAARLAAPTQRAAAQAAAPGNEPPLPRRGAAVARQAVIAVHSPKGGAGKTTLAINLALVYAASALRPSVALVDLDPEYPDVAAALQVAPGRTVLDWATEPEAPRNPSAFMVRHSPHLHVLPGPLRPTDRGLVTAPVAAAILSAMRRCFDLVVVDTGVSLNDDATLLALEEATHVLIVTPPYIPALRELDALARTLAPLRLDAKMRMVFNRVHSPRDGLIAEAGHRLPWPIAAVIPDDAEVSRLANAGRALAVDRPQSAFARAMRRLAHQLVPVGVDAPARRRLPFWPRLNRPRRAGA